MKAILESRNLRSHVINGVANEIKKEIKCLCSKEHDTILRIKTKPALEGFCWERIFNELESSTPTQLSILKNCLPKPREKSLPSVELARLPAICMSASILLKLSNPHVNLAQAVLSVVLRAGCAHKQVRTCIILNVNSIQLMFHLYAYTCKQVYRRLQKLMLCLSHQATLNMLDVVADGHDEKVWEWKENQMNHIGDAATQVS